MKRIIYIALSILLPLSVFSQQDTVSTSGEGAPFQQTAPVEVTKSQGDSAYINGNYTTAIQIYESLLEQGESADIYYNLGNSYYKSDNLAKAILNYERALLLKPGNGDIRFNLDIARSKTVDKIDDTPDIFYIGWIKSLINTTSVDVWAKWGIVFFLLFIVSLYFFFFSKRVLWKKIGFIAAIVTLVLVVSVNMFASYQSDILSKRNTAIVMTPSVTVRSTPNENGNSLFILHEGTKVNIKDDSMKGWKEIMLEDGKVGWIATSDIEII